MKYLIIIAIAIFGISINSNAQLPSYVPANGLIGWWSFNGNANDESSNGNNGTVNGASPTIDRFGYTASAFNFNGLNNYIDIASNNTINFQNEFSISIWVLTNQNNFNAGIIGKWNNFSGTLQDGQEEFALTVDDAVVNTMFALLRTNASSSSNIQVQFNNSNYNGNQWNQFTYIFNNNNITLYKNSLIVGTSSATGTIINHIQNLEIGRYAGGQPTSGGNTHFNGSLDDIGIWNRALTEQEISNLYNARNCSNNLTISQATNQFEVGSTANFVATTSDTFPSYIWQSDFGQGFQTLNNYGNYSGVNTNSLSISNVQLPNHTQPIRVISTSGECIDTSNVATISITDTCILTINDTITTLISVTDTLVINTLITGLTPPNNSNSIKVFPNPANSHITIDFGNFESMNDYTLTITNSIGQTVYTTPINEQSSYIDLSTWSGNGIYFVQIIDTLNNTIENRKIVLQ